MTYPDFVFDPTRTIDLISMGRVAVDLYSEQVGFTLKDAQSFRKYLGGCAGNIAVGTSRLGLKSMMFSCIGQDDMGQFIKDELQREGVRTDLLYESPNHLTGLVLLGINPPDRFPLLFYRTDCADMQLKPEHCSIDILKSSKALLITGTGLSTNSMFDATVYAIRSARAVETKVLLDLDFRPVLWGLTSKGNGENRYIHSESVSKEYQKVLPLCDLIVGTEEEICIAGGSDDFKQSLDTVRALTQCPIVIKKGDKGAIVDFSTSMDILKSRPFPVEILNVLGAGDGFMSGLLCGLLNGAGWETALDYANACGAIVVTRHGCAPAIPFKKELDYFIEHFESNPLIWKEPYLDALHQNLSHSQSNPILIKNPLGFSSGKHEIASMKKDVVSTGMNFLSIHLNQGEHYTFNPQFEFAALLMTGCVEFTFNQEVRHVERYDYFSENPYVLHCPSGEHAQVKAISDCEILLIETENATYFEPILFDEKNMLEFDNRGKDILEDTSYRIVRTVFDKRNRPDSNLVVGEIITFQGRWSSYPSHYHDQPEVYHYRFSEPQGYAFGEHGKEVLRIEHNDTYLIADGLSHAHCVAPGYALYTLWFIRHLNSNPYTVPIFHKEHEWTRKKESSLRVWTSTKALSPQ